MRVWFTSLKQAENRDDGIAIFSDLKHGRESFVIEWLIVYADFRFLFRV